MKKLVYAVLTVIFMMGIFLSCENDQVSYDEIYEQATDGSEVKRPGGNN